MQDTVDAVDVDNHQAVEGNVNLTVLKSHFLVIFIVKINFPSCSRQLCQAVVRLHFCSRQQDQVVVRSVAVQSPGNQFEKDGEGVFRCVFENRNGVLSNFLSTLMFYVENRLLMLGLFNLISKSLIVLMSQTIHLCSMGCTRVY